MWTRKDIYFSIFGCLLYRGVIFFLMSDNGFLMKQSNVQNSKHSHFGGGTRICYISWPYLVAFFGYCVYELILMVIQNKH